MNPKLQSFALTGLRLALATAFLSAVAGRLGLWGKYGSGWVKFVAYAGSVNWYLPAWMVPHFAITATILETAFGLALLAGFQIRNAALGSAGLLTLLPSPCSPVIRSLPLTTPFLLRPLGRSR